MRIMPICQAAGLILAIAAVASAQAQHKWAVRWKQESWSGLSGNLVVDGREITFPNRGRSEPEVPIRLLANGAPVNDAQRISVWDAVTGRELVTLEGHTLFESGIFKDRNWLPSDRLGVASVAFSPDGKRLASAGIDQTIKVWDVVGSKNSLHLRGHNGAVYDVAFSPDGQRLISASADRTVKVWDGVTGQTLLTLQGHTGMVFSAAFSPDGKRLASASVDQALKIWDAITGQEVLTMKGHTGFVRSVTFSPDGKRLASGSGDQTVKVWDASTGRELLTLKGHTGSVRKVTFSPDGNRLASAGEDKMVKVWDAATGLELLSLKGYAKSVNGVGFSPDGQLLAIGSSDGTVQLRKPDTGETLLTLRGFDAEVWSVAFSPDGQKFTAPGRFARTEARSGQARRNNDPPKLQDGLWIPDLSNPEEVHVTLAEVPNRTLWCDGMYLSYSTEADVPGLGFSKLRGNETAWKLANAKTTSEKRPAAKGPGAGPQYIQTDTKSFELEALHRPGWFLAADDEGRLKLSQATTARRKITITTETFWDDLNDGP